MKAKIKLIIALIATIIIAVYGIELGTRVSTGSGRAEYLVAAIIILVLLSIMDLRFYGSYRKEKSVN